MPERVAVVVPWRGGDSHRERSWKWCRTWWEQLGWPIFEVEHPPPDPFSRSWCINEGARRAWPWDVLVAIDADVFSDDAQRIRSAAESAAETGRLTIPHTAGADLSERGTRLLVAGRDGWERALYKQREVCTSRIWIMRRDLFELVGGFDERFRGWGHEDVAAFHSMRTLRGVDHLPGTAWHLWHRPSFPIARRTPEWRAGNELVNRYLTADRQGWPAIKPILDERAPNERWDRPGKKVVPQLKPPANRGIDVMVLTAGRKQYLERTLKSFEKNVRGDIRHRLILDDSGDAAFGEWLGTLPGYEIRRTRGRTGFTQAIRSAWRYEASRNGAGAPYLFHLEEDFTFDRVVTLADPIAILEAEPDLAQVALLRRPFFPPEIEAGGIIEEDPEAYERREHEGQPYLVHRKFFTTNPCVYRRSLLKTGWPNVAHSETRFGRMLVRRGKAFAFLGDGTPQVTHIGAERTGRGY